MNLILSITYNVLAIFIILPKFITFVSGSFVIQLYYKIWTNQKQLIIQLGKFSILFSESSYQVPYSLTTMLPQRKHNHYLHHTCKITDAQRLMHPCGTTKTLRQRIETTQILIQISFLSPSNCNYHKFLQIMLDEFNIYPPSLNRSLKPVRVCEKREPVMAWLHDGFRLSLVSRKENKQPKPFSH